MSSYVVEQLFETKYSHSYRSSSSGNRAWLLNALPRCRIRRLLLILSFLDTLCTRVGISQGYNQAFIQTDSELRYLVDGAPGNHFAEALPEDNGYEDISDNTGIKVLKSPIQFEPPELDFKEQPIGLPVLRKVKVFNLNAQSSIQMLSISGNTIHFHCSFFKDKVIPPSGNTSFDVVFLGREEGVVENTLYIHTSAGSFRFQVRAIGTPNPYRLKPLVGVRMPLNSSYSPLIQLHNPHSEPIQVLEMYSSGGDLHLELPGGETEGPQTLWQIPPYQTKSVMKANFVARLENNHTAYIRIKTNTTGAEFLYLPLEVEVSSQPGIYCPQELIDFGLVPSNSEPKTLKLFILNSGTKAIPVQNVIATPVSEAVSIDFHPLKIAPDTLRPTVIAEVTFDPSLVNEDGLYTGKIVIKSKNSQFKVTIPYRAHVLSGHLFVNESITHFHLKDRWGYEEDMHQQKISSNDKKDTKDNADGDIVDNPIGVNGKDSDHFTDLDESDQPPESSELTLNPDYYNKMTRNFTVTNHFKVAVAIHNVSLAPEAEEYFTLEHPFTPTILQAGKKKSLVVLSLKEKAWEKRTLDSFITIHTNISNINIPLVCFHGKVEKFFPGSPSQNMLDYGTLGMKEKRDHFFAIINKNPVTLNLKTWGSNLTGSLVELMGVEAGSQSDILRRANFSDMTRRLKIPPGHYMVFRVGIFTPDEEGETNATVFVDTDYHAFRVPFKYRVAKGSLNTVPRELVFDPAFPGKHVELKLKVYSSFSEEMITDAVSTVPLNPQFRFEHAVADGRTVIMSQERSYIGKVVFDPAAGCQLEEACYCGFSINSKLGKEWYKSTTLQDNPGESDVAIAHTLYNRYLQSTQMTSGLSSFNITLNLDTNHVRGFLFNARAKLTWPRVTKPEINVFPLTQVGNYSYKDIILVNPSDRRIYFHLVPLNVYPDGIKAINLLPTWAKSHLKESSSTTASNYATADGKFDASVFSNVPPSTFRVMSIHDDGNGSSESCSSGSSQPTLQAVNGFSDDFESKFDVSLHQDTKGFILEPGRNARVRIRFAPDTVYNQFQQCILVRNNLTGIELVTFSGESVLGEFKFGKFRHDHHSNKIEEERESAILEFDMKEKHLKDCDRAKQTRYSSPVLSVKRSFRLKNTGLTPIWFAGFDVEGVPCEGYGFKVLNCEGFNLEPSGTKDIDIAFSPDFTLSRVARQLTLRTSINGGMSVQETGGIHTRGLVNYTLVATLPSHMLAVCGSILPRPGWESYLFYSINIFMCFALVVVLVAAIMESDRIVRFTSGMFQPTVLLQTDVSTTGQDGHSHLTHHRTELLDLRSIEAKVNQEIGKRNLSANLIQSNNDISSSLRQRKGQGGTTFSSANISNISSNNSSSVTLQNLRKRNTSLDNQRSSSQHQNNVNGNNSAMSVTNSSFSNTSASSSSVSQINSGSSHISATKEVIREQTESNWKIVSSTRLLAIVVKFITWPLLYLGNTIWNYTTQKKEFRGDQNTHKSPDEKEKDNITTDSNSDQQENKGSPVPGGGGPFNKSSKKNKNKNVATNNNKKKASSNNKSIHNNTQSLDDLETSSTTTDASNDVDIDVGMNSSFSGKVSEIDDNSYDYLPGLSSSTPSGNKKGRKKTKQLQSANVNSSADKQNEQCKKNQKANSSKKELTSGNKNVANNAISECNLNLNGNKDMNKKQQKQEDNNKVGIAANAPKNAKQQAKVKPNEGNVVQPSDSSKSANVFGVNGNSRAPFRNTDTQIGGEGNIAPSTFGISTNGPLSSSGIFSSLDQPLNSNNHVLGQKTKKVPPPVGKILPEIKKPENKGAQYGPIGAKPHIPMQPILPTHGGMPNKRASTPWNMGELNSNNILEATAKPMMHRQNSSPVHNGQISGMSYGNQPHPMTSTPPPMPPPGFNTNQANAVLHQQGSNFPNSLNIGSASVSPTRRGMPPIANINSNLGGMNNSDIEWHNAMGLDSSNQLQQQNTSSSWMIALQEERRRKTEEYLKQRSADWPGFGSGPTTGQGFTIDDLWDDPSSASGGERRQPSRFNNLNLSSFDNTSMQQNTQTGGQSSWNAYNDVWPSSPVDPYWAPTSTASNNRSGAFGNLDGDNICEPNLQNTTAPNSSESSLMMQMMNNPSLSSIWSTPSTTSNDSQQNIKSTSNDFSEPPPTSNAVPTSSWPMYQQNRTS